MNIYASMANQLSIYTSERILSQSVIKRHKFSISFLKPLIENMPWQALTTHRGWIDTIPILIAFTKTKRLKCKQRTIRDVFSILKTYSKLLGYDIYRFNSYVRSNLWTDIKDNSDPSPPRLSDDDVKRILNVVRQTSLGNNTIPLLYHSTNLSIRLSKIVELAIHLILDTSSRPSEVLTIPVHNELLSQNMVQRTILKGLDKGKSIHCPISNRTSNLIKQFLSSQNPIEEGSPLLDISKGMMMTGAKSIFVHAGIVGQWSNLHRLRGYSASSSVRGGSTPLELQTLGRWSSSDISMRYYVDEVAKSHLSKSAFENIQSTYEKVELFEPLALLPSTVSLSSSGVEECNGVKKSVRRLRGSNPRPHHSIPPCKKVEIYGTEKYSYLY
jgi:integrase